MHFEVLSTKYVTFNHLRWFFENFVTKFLFFLAFFLEFFGLGNNLNLQDHYYTRTITLILGIERNKKSDFNGAFLARLARILTNFLRRKTRFLQDFLLLPKTLLSRIFPTLRFLSSIYFPTVCSNYSTISH